MRMRLSCSTWASSIPSFHPFIAPPAPYTATAAMVLSLALRLPLSSPLGLQLFRGKSIALIRAGVSRPRCQRARGGGGGGAAGRERRLVGERPPGWWRPTADFRFWIAGVSIATGPRGGGAARRWRRVVPRAGLDASGAAPHMRRIDVLLFRVSARE